MILDLFSEVFDYCRNACIGANKLLTALQNLHSKRSITNSSDADLDNWMFEVGAAVTFIFINFNQTSNTLIRF